MYVEYVYRVLVAILVEQDWSTGVLCMAVIQRSVFALDNEQQKRGHHFPFR